MRGDIRESETDRVKEALDLGVGMHVSKPYGMKRIGVAVRDVLSP